MESGGCTHYQSLRGPEKIMRRLPNNGRAYGIDSTL
jgi:hypothetical protein